MVDLETCYEGVRDVVFVLDPDGAVRWASPSVERVLGYDRETLVGEDLFGYVHPDDEERVAALVEDPAGTAEADVEPVRYRMRCDDETWREMETASPVRREPETGGATLVATDVTEALQLERGVERYEVILGALDDGVYAITPEGEIVYVNESYARMKGVDREELVGTSIYEWGSEGATEKILRAREALEVGEREVGVVEFEFTTVGGGTIPVEMRFSTVNRPDDELERAGVVRDVTDRKARERALREKNERLEEFASIVSHDLRNPLNVAQGRVRMAIDAGSTEGLAAADEALCRIEEMVGDLLTLAREGRTIEETQQVGLADAVREAWGTTDTESATLTVEDAAEVTIVADPGRLRNLLENLLRNATRHGGDGVAVTVGATDEGFFVEDDGRGIPAADRERVFESGYTTGDGGTGFGMSIVERIAEAHGWSVSVGEGADGGARISVTDVDVVDG